MQAIRDRARTMRMEGTRPMRGFTLIELLVVAGILAILAALAVPAYSRYGYRARRVEGKELLLRIVTAQERYYATYHRYGQLAELGFPDPAPSAKGNYQATVALSSGAKPQSFVATVKPQLAQTGDACGALAMDDTGKKTPTSSDGPANRNGTCW